MNEFREAMVLAKEKSEVVLQVNFHCDDILCFKLQWSH